MSPTNAPALRPPIEARWRVRFESEYMGLRPVGDGRGLIVVAAHDRVVGLDAANGEKLWEHAQPAPITEIQACVDGPVLALGGEKVELAAYRWNGDSMWRTVGEIGTGGDRLRGCGAEFIAIGVPETDGSTRQLCQVRDARTGTVTASFPCAGDLPDRHGEDFVFSIRGEGGGLFILRPPAKKPRRLLDVGNWVRVVAEGIAVVDTYDDDNRFSRLIAVDLASGAVLWEDAGGPNFTLAVDRGQLAAAVAVDDERVAMTLRDLKTGRIAWTAKPIKAEYVTPLLAADCVLASIMGERIEIFDRADGHLDQTLAHESSLVEGGCLDPAGLIDIASSEVACFRGAAA